MTQPASEKSHFYFLFHKNRVVLLRVSTLLSTEVLFSVKRKLNISIRFVWPRTLLMAHLFVLSLRYKLNVFVIFFQGSSRFISLIYLFQKFFSSLNLDVFFFGDKCLVSVFSNRIEFVKKKSKVG